MAQAKNVQGYVGFANLPDQVHRKSAKRGFEFTLMVVGESGLGKSTFINSLLLTDLYSPEAPGPPRRSDQTALVEQAKVVRKEGGGQLLLTVVDTPGFGDAADSSDCWQPVLDYIDNKFEDYLNAESRVYRRQTPDSRVQGCLYFLSPSGRGLKPLDAEFMKRLHDKVNVIPLIAKADTLTPEECRRFKKRIMREIQEHQIKIYEFPGPGDAAGQKPLRKIQDRLPLAVVASDTVVEVDGRRVRGRKYPWGVAEVENGDHCDFAILRHLLMRTHTQHLRDLTNNVHYENYRSRKLAALARPRGRAQPLLSPRAQREEHAARLRELEARMQRVFQLKLREKVQKLRESEARLLQRREQMRLALEQQHRELDEKWRQFEQDKAEWEARQRPPEPRGPARAGGGGDGDPGGERLAPARRPRSPRPWGGTIPPLLHRLYPDPTTKGLLVCFPGCLGRWVCFRPMEMREMRQVLPGAPSTFPFSFSFVNSNFHLIPESLKSRGGGGGYSMS